MEAARYDPCTMSISTMALETETAIFEEKRLQWIAEGHENEFAVVFGEDLLSFFPTLEEAFTAGTDTYGDAEFLVKRVTPHDDVQTIQRVHWGSRGKASD